MANSHQLASVVKIVVPRKGLDRHHTNRGVLLDFCRYRRRPVYRFCVPKTTERELPALVRMVRNWFLPPGTRPPRARAIRLFASRLKAIPAVFWTKTLLVLSQLLKNPRLVEGTAFLNHVGDQRFLAEPHQGQQQGLLVILETVALPLRR